MEQIDGSYFLRSIVLLLRSKAKQQELEAVGVTLDVEVVGATMVVVVQEDKER